MKAIALDDERPALDVIDSFCRHIDSIELVQLFTRTGEARLYLETHPVDLIFLDINMPAQNGIDFIRELSKTSVETERRATDRMVIFTTAYSEYAVESYTLHAVDYLLKPFTLERFSQAVQKAHKQFMRQQTEAGQDYLLLRVDYGLVKVNLAQILFIEGLDNYLKIHLMDQKPIVVRLTIKAILDKLPGRAFVRVHRSYIVALNKIQSLRNKIIQIGYEEIPLSSTYETEFFSAFKG